MFTRCLRRAAMLASMAALAFLLQSCFPPTTPKNGAGQPVDPHTGAAAPGATLQ